ncbi:hypothetical protein G3C52_005229 [Salmonella enterica]|nr:hypothetical protein [Salmonella enterica]EDU8777156.1 hypothetical protein [Salmonella enterica subsp. enterica serovar Poona]EDV2765347.1 hypothetical protein [Salmonella enterica subsp. enterica serovar Soahanina]EDV6964878.1 hypothetical protein [Salmonella enterica subsp. enterica serovar Minnesota]EDV3470922.1 hypothetical protein [Salmonella enterica subsp. enterica serovar Poona]
MLLSSSHSGTTLLHYCKSKSNIQVAIGGYQRPTRPGDHGRLGAVIMPGLAG